MDTQIVNRIDVKIIALKLLRTKRKPISENNSAMRNEATHTKALRRSNAKQKFVIKLTGIWSNKGEMQIRG